MVWILFNKKNYPTLNADIPYKKFGLAVLKTGGRDILTIAEFRILTNKDIDLIDVNVSNIPLTYIKS
jgi:hypothetical protein